MPASSARSHRRVEGMRIDDRHRDGGGLGRDGGVHRVHHLRDMFAFAEPVHCELQSSRAQASCRPYCVGTKNGLVVTWLTNTSFQRGCGWERAASAASGFPHAAKQCQRTAQARAMQHSAAAPHCSGRDFLT